MTQEALRMALEVLEKNTKHLPADFDYHFEAITAIKEALAQTQEPDDIASILACRDMLDAQPVPPRTWVGSGNLEDSNAYTTTPQRTWVGLTNNDWNSTPYTAEFRAGAEWADDKLKQKNGYAEEKNT